MPFPPHLISNWVQHETVAGVCSRCGLTFKAAMPNGVVWEKEGDLLLCTPLTLWTSCTPINKRPHDCNCSLDG